MADYSNRQELVIQMIRRDTAIITIGLDIFVAAFRRGTPFVRHICRHVPTWHAVCLAYLSSRSDATRCLSGIFVAAFRRGSPFIRHIWRRVPTRHAACPACPASLPSPSDGVRRRSDIFIITLRRATSPSSPHLCLVAVAADLSLPIRQHGGTDKQ